MLFLFPFFSGADDPLKSMSFLLDLISAIDDLSFPFVPSGWAFTMLFLTVCKVQVFFRLNGLEETRHGFHRRGPL